MWDDNLDRINEMQRQTRTHPDSFIHIIGYMRINFHLPYRQTEGIIKATGKSLPNHPSYKYASEEAKQIGYQPRGSFLLYPIQLNQ